MSALLAVALALAAGWGAWRRHALLPGAPDAVSGTVLWAVAITVAWLSLLDLVGVPWSAPLLFAPAAGGIALGLSSRALPRATAPGPPDGWAIGATIAVAARAAWVAAVPAFGWDFRYIWGLKGRVLALARGLDWSWLAWPGHAFAHPDYPLAWSELLAAGKLAGAPVARAAALWQAVLVVAIAAGCWQLCIRAPRPARALAAVAGGWSAVIFAPIYSGYAEPLLAFLLVVAVAALPEPAADRPGAAITLLVAAPALALTKNEGMVLAAGVILAALVANPWRRVRWVALAAGAAVAGWRFALAGHGVSGEGVVLAPSAVVHRLAVFPAALVAVATPELMAVAVALVLALAGLRDRQALPTAVVLGVWAAGIGCAYLTTPHDLTWHLSTSLDRVLAVPLPAAVALALASLPSARSGAEPARGSAPDG